MSIVQNPIVGRSSGKFSNAIFSKWKDKNTLRSKPLVVLQPNTPDQLTQRSLFAAAVRYARMVLSLVRFSLKSFSTSMSEFNSFMKLNIGLIDSATYKFAVATISSIRFSLGSLSLLSDFEIASASTSACVLNWETVTVPPDYDATMKVSCVIYNQTTDTLHIFQSAADWVTGSASLSLSSAPSDVLHAFAFVNTENLSSFSSSQYIGTRVVA